MGQSGPSAAFLESVAVALNRWLEKKGREAEPVANGIRPARKNDILELDECWTYVRKRSNKRWLWVALCRRIRQIVAFIIGDRSAKTCARLWGRIQRSDSSTATGRARASVTSGSPPKRQLLQSSRMTQLTGRSESPVARWPTSKDFSDGCAKSWPGMSDGREQRPSQKECST